MKPFSQSTLQINLSQIHYRDNYTCQKCGAINTELHCHHYEGVEVNPVESADIDQCITLCKKCHNNIHKKDKCGIKDYQRGKC